MNTAKMSEWIKYPRRRFLSVAAMSFAAVAQDKKMDKSDKMEKKMDKKKDGKKKMEKKKGEGKKKSDKMDKMDKK